MRRRSVALGVGFFLALTPAPAVAEEATAYSPCSSGDTMADGSETRRGSLAHNGYAFGTRVWVEPAVFGRHRYTVRDRIGAYSEADFWTPSCSGAIAFGRRTVRITVGWRGWEARRHARSLMAARGREVYANAL